MASDLSALGDLVIQVGGDISPLEQSLNQIPQAAQQVAAQVQDAFDQHMSGFDNLDAGVQKVEQSFSSLGTASQGVRANLSDLAQTAQSAGGAANDLAQNTDKVTESTSQLLSKYMALRLAMDIAKVFESFAQNALEAYDQVQRLTLSVELLTGSLSDTQGILQGVEQIAKTQPFAFPELAQAAQKMAAFGVDAAQIPGLLNVASDAAAATGNSFQSVAQSLARVAETGQITSRQLVQLGVSAQDIANTLGVSMDQVTAMMKKGVLDAETAVDILRITVEQKFGGAAGAMAATIGGQFQILQNNIHAVMVQVGQDLAPFAQHMIDVANSVLPALNNMAVGFRSLPEPIRAAIVTLGELLPVIALATIAFTAFDIAAGPLVIAVTAIAGALTLLNFPQITEKFQGMVSVIKDNLPGIQELFSGLSDKVKAVGQAMVDAAKSNVALNSALNGLKSAGTDAQNGLKGLSLDLLVVASSAQSAQYWTEWFGTSFKSMTNSIVALNAKLGPSYDAVAQAATLSGQKQEAAAIAAEGAAKVAAAAAAAAAKAAANWNHTFETTEQRAIDALKAMQDGSKTADQAVSALSSVIETASLNADKLNTKSKALLDTIKQDLVIAQQMAAQAQNNEALDKLTGQIADLEIKANDAANKVPASFAQMMDAIGKGVQVGNLSGSLDKMIADLKAKLETISPDLDATLGEGLRQQIANLTAASQRALDFANVLKLIGQDKSMAQLGGEIESLVKETNLGQVSTQQLQAAFASLEKDMSGKVLPAMQAGVQVTPQFTSALLKLNEVAPGLGTTLAAAAQQGPDAFSQAVFNMAEKTRVSSAAVSAALKDLGGQDLTNLSNNMTKAGDDIVIAFKGITDATALTSVQFVASENDIEAWGNKVIPIMVATGQAITDDVLVQIAKISPAVAQAAKDGPDALRLAIDQLKTQTEIATLHMTDAYRVFGQTMTATLQNQITLQQAALDKLIQTKAPLSDILAGQLKVEQSQMAYNTAVGASAESQLQLAIKVSQTKAQQDALNDSTNRLAVLYGEITTAFNKAWTDLGKGIGDAIASGQNFGQVFANVLSQLKKQILEDIVGDVFKQLKDAILTNTDAVSSFGKVFSSIFGGGASGGGTSIIQQGVDSASVSIKYFGQATTTTMQQTAAQVQSSTSSMISSFSALIPALDLVAAAISAIASIVGDIELAHMEKTLGQIETNTRRVDNGVNGSGGLTQSALTTAQKITALVDLMWSPVVSLLIGISGNLDDIKYALQTGIVVAGLTATGSAAHPISFGDSVQQLQNAVTTYSDATSSFSSSADTLASTIDTTATSLASSAVIVANSASVSATAANDMAIAAATQVAVAQAQGIAVANQGVGSTAIVSPVAISSGGTVSTQGVGNLTSGQTQPWISVPITIQGNVVGQAGMQQLSDIVGQNVINKLRQTVSLIKGG